MHVCVNIGRKQPTGIFFLRTESRWLKPQNKYLLAICVRARVFVNGEALLGNVSVCDIVRGAESTFVLRSSAISIAVIDRTHDDYDDDKDPSHGGRSVC